MQKYLEFKDFDNLNSLLEKVILVKKDFWKVITDLKGNEIADYIQQLILPPKDAEKIEEPLKSYIVPGDRLIDFPKDVKTINIISKNSKKADTIEVTFIKKDGKLQKNEMKIGRVIQGLIGTFKPEEIETFVRLVHSEQMELADIPFEIKIVDEEKIVYYYNEENYNAPGKGELGKSCMAGSDCSSYLDFFTFFPDKVKLAIMVTPEDKVLARVLIWSLDNGTKYMDRMYAANPKYGDLLYKWGKENGIKHFFDKTEFDILRVTLPKSTWKAFEYPHLDTFELGYIDKKGNLVLVGNAIMLDRAAKTVFKFVSTSGEYEILHFEDGILVDEDGELAE